MARYHKSIAAGDREYRPFTPEAAARVAKQFGIVDYEGALFQLVTGATDSYEKYRLMPDLQQRKSALEKLSTALGDLVSVAAKHQRELEPSLWLTLLPRLGELLTYQGIEELLNERVARGLTPAAMAGREATEEQTRLNRSVTASEAGPKLFTALLKEMQLAIDDALKFARQNQGGRPPKHLLRHTVISVLGRYYSWFFDKYPTSSATGHFAKFCCAVLQELECDLGGVERAIPCILKRARLLRAQNIS